MKKQNKKGFSLLELILVLGVGSMMAFMRFQDMKNEQETVIAKAVGQQMKQIGEAVNRYISIRYDKLSTLSYSGSQSSDPGPRTCSVNGCEITYQTLVNEGLLPYLSLNGDNNSSVKLDVWGSQKIRGDLALSASNDGKATGAIAASGNINSIGYCFGTISSTDFNCSGRNIVFFRRLDE